jgi:hypothetical protein
MTRDNEKGEEFGFGHGGPFMRSRPAFAIGLMALFSYRRDVQKPEIRAYD